MPNYAGHCIVKFLGFLFLKLGLGIRSQLWVNHYRPSLNKNDSERIVSSLLTKVQSWAIHLGRKWQKSDHERFAQVAHDKRVTWVIRI